MINLKQQKLKKNVVFQLTDMQKKFIFFVTWPAIIY